MGTRQQHHTWEDPELDIFLAALDAVPRFAMALGHLSFNEQSFVERYTCDSRRLDEALKMDLWIPESPLLLIKANDDGPALPTPVHAAFLGNLTPGQARFSILDPRGLGEKFATFLKLIDLEEHLIGSKIWTSQNEVEQRLADLCEHAEKIIQKYLRDEFASLADYNAAAGELAEPYQVLVIADFPNGFSPVALERLAALSAMAHDAALLSGCKQAPPPTCPKTFELQHFFQRGIVLAEDHGTLQNLPRTYR